MPVVAPSILSANFANLERDVRRVADAGADWIHVDVMDGHFVPNITIGPVVVEHLRKVTQLPLDVHLMIENPDRYIPDFRKAGADIISVHQEACPHLHRTLDLIHRTGAKAGAVLNPATPPETLRYVLDDLDLILVMSVNPGFGGQEFVHGTVEKIQRLKDLVDYRRVFIEVDGGINEETGRKVVEAGATVLVAGSYVFSSADVSDPISRLKRLSDRTTFA